MPAFGLAFIIAVLCTCHTFVYAEKISSLFYFFFFVVFVFDIEHFFLRITK